MPPEPKNEYETKLLSNIRNKGWQVTSVFDRKGIDPTFSYSIGIFETLKRPEIIIIGVHPATAQSIINDYGDNIKSGARQYVVGKTYDDLLPGFDVLFIEANEEARKNYALSCKWFYQGIDFPLVQCVWQSEDHIWPWDTSARDGLKRDQPLFGEIPKDFR